jgi:hypothetical protein
MEFDTRFAAEQYDIMSYYLRMALWRPDITDGRRYQLLISAHLAAHAAGIPTAFVIAPTGELFLTITLPAGMLTWPVAHTQAALAPQTDDERKTIILAQRDQDDRDMEANE